VRHRTRRRLEEKKSLHLQFVTGEREETASALPVDLYGLGPEPPAIRVERFPVVLGFLLLEAGQSLLKELLQVMQASWVASATKR
jgi:hypothetical protein